MKLDCMCSPALHLEMEKGKREDLLAQASRLLEKFL